jgi:hypothetical protein
LYWTLFCSEAKLAVSKTDACKLYLACAGNIDKLF